MNISQLISNKITALKSPDLSATTLSHTDLFSYNNIRADKLQSAQKAFSVKFLNDAKALEAILPKDVLKDYQTSVESRLNAITEKIFKPLSSVRPNIFFPHSVKNASKKAEKLGAMALQRLAIDAEAVKLKSEIRSSSIAPNVIQQTYVENKETKTRYILIRKAPQIENLVLRGGGAKGITYGAHIEQMQMAGQLDGLKRIAGTSAGALTATCLASGVSASQFDKFESDALFRGGPKDYIAGNAAIYPGLKLGTNGIASAIKSVETIDVATSRSVFDYLAEHQNNDLFKNNLENFIKDAKSKHPNDAEIEEKIKARLKVLSTAPDFSMDRTGKMVTFSDLSMLHAIAPDKFKELATTSWDPKNEQVIYFNTEETPDLEVCFAARASMSFPMVFKPVVLDLGDGKGQRLLMDGGIGSNLPTEAFFGENSTVTTPNETTETASSSDTSKTMLLTFDREGEAYSIMTSGKPAIQPKGFLSKISQWLFGKDIADTYHNDFTKIWQAGPNALPIFHGKIKTLSSGVDDKTAHAARLQAANESLEQIRLRAHQASYVVCATLEEAAGMLTDAEKAAIEQPKQKPEKAAVYPKDPSGKKPQSIDVTSELWAYLHPEPSASVANAFEVLGQLA